MIRHAPKWVAEAQWNPMKQHHEVYIARNLPDGDREVVVGLELERVAPGFAPSEPTLSDTLGDTEDFLRSMLNLAWEAGLRPDGFEDTRREMVATQAHLQDMRLLAGVIIENGC